MSEETARRMLLDKRVAERNINKGLLSRSEHESYLAALPDMSENAEAVSVRLYDEPEEPSAADEDVEDDEIDSSEEDDDETDG